MVDYKELGNLNGCPFLLLLIFGKFFGIIFLELLQALAVILKTCAEQNACKQCPMKQLC
jgi:hypothetical protein